MKPRGNGWSLALLVCAMLCALPGCFGVSQNPSTFPYLRSTGDIIPTHAKPSGAGYYANFDPHAIRLEVRPLTGTNPVRTDLVLIATVYDETGKPRRGRRVEWMVEGVGNLIEVDESGFWPGRGWKSGNKYGVSYTNYLEHLMCRGNKNGLDDFVVRPGQSWCVLTSAVEGDTHVTVWAPGIHEWEKSKVHVTLRWVDAGGVFPAPIAVPAGSEAVLITKVFRHTDQQPLANYKVRYRVLDGPPALFVGNRATEFEAVSDLSGNAIARLVQQTPTPGVNRIGMEIIRPPDPTAPSGVGVVIAKGETTVEWLAPAVTMTHVAPPTASVGQEVPFTITLTNNGKSEMRSATVTNPIPEGLTFKRSNPPAVNEGGKLIFTIGRMMPGEMKSIEIIFVGQREGTFTSCASVVTEEGMRDEKCARTQLVQAAPATLKISVQGPPSAALDAPVTVQLSLRNDGGTPATNVKLTVDLGGALEHEKSAKTIFADLKTLQPGENRDLGVLTLTPRKLGRLVATFKAEADGSLITQAEYVVMVQQSKLSLSMKGPKLRYLGQVAEFELVVTNDGDAPLTNITIVDTLPPELGFTSSTEGGVPGAGKVLWTINTLGPREAKSVVIKARCEQLAKAAINRAEASVQGAVAPARAEAAVEVLGLPALQLEVIDIGDPVEVGKRVTYEIRVTNTGSLPVTLLEIIGRAPGELKLVPNGFKGPTNATILGQVITFDKLDALPPQKTATYTIETEALKPGDVRFQVEMRSQSSLQPVIQQEATRIYDPALRPGVGEAAPSLRVPGN